jgi:squalene-hopene/tetraprenyl-beta-curcumene cyclase
VAENPEMGEQGLFYYYHTMAKALAAYGDDFIIDAAGTERNWRKELLERLISLQDGEGFWVNKNNRWWENKKELVTAYTVLAIEHVIGH